MVEPRGVEPLSESTLTGTSPGADGCLHSLTQARAVTLLGLVESLFMVRATLSARTDATKMTPLPARGPSGADGCGRIRRQRELRYRCSLIYKLPILRMLGASARYSRLHTPVETGTAPWSGGTSHRAVDIENRYSKRSSSAGKLTPSPAWDRSLRGCRW